MISALRVSIGEPQAAEDTSRWAASGQTGSRYDTVLTCEFTGGTTYI